MHSMSKKKPKVPSNTIAQNKKARHDYFIEEDFEAGLALQGWEVKSLREGKVQITDAYVLLKNDEAWLLGVTINPLNTTSTHYVADPTRTRKLLLNRKELAKIQTAVSQKGFACVCTGLYWKNHLVKCKIALAKGKDKADKRESQKEHDWNLDKRRILRQQNR